MKLSISNLEQLSGVPIHTIRIWERRYNALNPTRSEGNTRIYSDDHLNRLLDIVSLVQAGIKVSVACSYDHNQRLQFLEAALDKTKGIDDYYEFYISQLVKFGLSYNELQFNKILNTSIKNNGLENTYQFVIYPLLQRVGLLWRKEEVCPSQEHFLTNIIRQKLMVMIDQISLSSQNKATWLLFLPADEGHDIALLYASYVLRSMGFKVIYLGDKVPLDSVKSAIENNKIDHLLLFMVRQRPQVEASNYLNTLANQYDGIKIHLSGNSELIKSLNLSEKISHIQSISNFHSFLHQLAHAN